MQVACAPPGHRVRATERRPETVGLGLLLFGNTNSCVCAVEVVIALQRDERLKRA